MSPFLPWRILHVDLAGDVPGVGRDDTHGPLFVVLWHETLPLGDLKIAQSELPLTPLQLAERAAGAIAPAVGHWTIGRGFEAPLPVPARLAPPRGEAPPLEALLSLRAPLAALGVAGGIPPASARRPRLSVIVCTRDRPEQLARCLRALAGSREPADEIVVVDSASTSNATQRVVDGLGGASYVLAPRPGLSRARNVGLRRATGEVVAFTDDDVVVHPTWTTRIRDALVEERFTAMTGLVLPSTLETPSQVHFETVFGGFSQGYRRMVFDRVFFDRTRRWGVRVWRLGAGANMAFRTEVVRDLGGFDERLGAGAAGCSEDSELWYRMLAAGRTLVYDPRAVVFHDHRGDTPALREQMHLYMRGHVAALLVQYERHRDVGNLRRIATGLPPYYARRAAEAFFARSSGRIETLGSEVGGAIAGLGYYLAHRRDGGLPRLLEPKG